MTTANIPSRIEGNGKHLFDVEIMLNDKSRKLVEVIANNRNQAARITADKTGLLVCSVNMIG